MDTKAFSLDDAAPSTTTKMGNGQLSIAGGQSDYALPLILNPMYFVIVEQRSNTHHQKIAHAVVALCQTCQMKISGSAKVTSNFLQHLRSKHSNVYQHYLRQKQKHTMVPSALHRTEKKQSQFDERLLHFVIATCTPPSLVEHPAFMSLFDSTHLKLRSRRCLVAQLEARHDDMVAKIKAHIEKSDYICCTAEIWSAAHVTFLGYASHWIDCDDFSRKSVALACRRLGGADITYDNVHNIISEINKQFGISSEKLECIVTDNGSNFAMALKDFGIQYANSDDSGQDDLVFDSSPLVMEKHLGCASYTLNLLATTDFLKALRKSSLAYKTHRSAFKKCAAIWHKIKRPDLAEELSEIHSLSLNSPNTQWSSVYAATRQLIALTTDKLFEVCACLEVENLNFFEMEYLQEFCEFMQPSFGEGFDFLFADADIYFGYLAPTLLTLKVKLRRFASLPAAKALKEVSRYMEEALVERFRPFFELDDSWHDAIFAAITCPTVKLLNCAQLLKVWRETAPQCTAAFLQQLFLAKVCGSQVEIKTEGGRIVTSFETTGNISSASTSSSSALSTTHSFFQLEDSEDEHFMVTAPTQSSTNNFNITTLQNELKEFLDNTDNSKTSLNRYPLLKQLFLKYNTALPASTPMERLFQFGEIINNYQRHQLSERQYFEKIVLAKANSELNANFNLVNKLPTGFTN